MSRRCHAARSTSVNGMAWRTSQLSASMLRLLLLRLPPLLYLLLLLQNHLEEELDSGVVGTVWLPQDTRVLSTCSGGLLALFGTAPTFGAEWWRAAATVIRSCRNHERRPHRGGPHAINLHANRQLVSSCLWSTLGRGDAV